MDLPECPSVSWSIESWVKLKLSDRFPASIRKLEAESKHSELVSDDILTKLRGYRDHDSENDFTCRLAKNIKSGGVGSVASEFTKLWIEPMGKEEEGEDWYTLSFESYQLSDLREFVHENDPFKAMITNIMSLSADNEDIDIFFGGYPGFVSYWYSSYANDDNEEENEGESKGH